MGALEVVFGSKRKTRVGLVNFDASMTETHSMRNAVTDHPVEVDPKVGAQNTIADHIRREPDEITINGIVTDTPILFLASLQAESPLEGDNTPVRNRVDLAYAEIQRVMQDGELVEILTTLRDYENMAITAFSIQRDAANGNVMNATITAREVTIVQTESIESPDPENPANTDSQDRGTKPPTESGASGPVNNGIAGVSG